MSSIYRRAAGAGDEFAGEFEVGGAESWVAESSGDLYCEDGGVSMDSEWRADDEDEVDAIEVD